MLTLSLQCLSAALLLSFGLVALAVYRHAQVLPPDRRAGWLLTGVGFTLLGVSSLVQNAAAVGAFVSGPGTDLYEAYLRWAPAANHSRVFLGIAYGCLLGFLAWDRRFPGRTFWRRAVAGLLLAAGLGALAAWAEGPFRMEVHGVSTSIGLTVEMLAFGLALLLSTVRGSFDVFLFAPVMLYTLMMALSVPIWTGMTLAQSLAGWAPAPWLLEAQRIVFEAAMVGMAAFRLALLRRGVRVGEVLGTERELRVRFFE
ncbi:MAG: hypothetical protein M3P24_06260 [Gemmatimonadota bacterium]|nr:hypothetical protein [Gemmatimonadota bacterium]